MYLLNPASAVSRLLLAVLMSDNTGPILVKAAPQTGDIADDTQTTPPLSPSGALSLPLPEDILSTISDNTADLQDRLDKFVNGLTAKIQSVSSLPHASERLMVS